MIFEYWMLFGAAVLGVVHISASSFTFKTQIGNAYTVSARDIAVSRAGVAGRCERAQANFQETFPIFVALVFLLDGTGTMGDLSRWGSGAYLVGRVIYLPLYAAGVPWIRTFAWYFATLGLVLTGVQVIL
ncbi:MAG: MAPEG family protein [Stappiaceae bacterium]